MIRVSPSKLEGCSVCPCYSRDNSDNRDAADEGILMHKAVETEDLSTLDNEEQATMVQMTMDYINNIKAMHGPDVRDFREVDLPAADKSNLPRGIIDRILISSQRVDIFDYKFGRKFVVDASENLQLKCYVAKAFVQFLPRNAPGVKTATGHLVSPRLNDISLATFDRGVIPAIQEDIRKIEKAIMEPFKVPNPARPDLCAQCAHLATCPAVTKSLAKAIPMFNLPVPESFHPDAIVSPEDRSVALQLGEVFKGWHEHMRRQDTQFLREGGEIPLYGLITKPGRAQLGDLQEVFERLKETGLIQSVEDLLPICSTTLNKLVKLLDDDPSMTDTKEQVMQLLGDLVQVSPDISFLARSRKKADQPKFLPNPFKETPDDKPKAKIEVSRQPEFLPNIALGAEREHT